MARIEDTVDDGVHDTPVAPPDALVSERVVDAVASFHDVDPVELDPLYSTVDPDALDALWATAEDRRPSDLSFQYEDLRVTIDADGTVRVSDPT